MEATQKRLVEKLLNNQLKMRFPDVKIVKTSNAIAVVMGERREIRRRNTVSAICGWETGVCDGENGQGLVRYPMDWQGVKFRGKRPNIKNSPFFQLAAL